MTKVRACRGAMITTPLYLTTVVVLFCFILRVCSLERIIISINISSTTINTNTIDSVLHLRNELNECRHLLCIRTASTVFCCAATTTTTSVDLAVIIILTSALKHIPLFLLLIIFSAVLLRFCVGVRSAQARVHL